MQTLERGFKKTALGLTATEERNAVITATENSHL